MSSNKSPLIYDPLSRRMFLKGLGSTLAIPLLPSLMDKAYAADGGLDARFIFMNVTHGRTHATWYPSNLALVNVAPGVRAQGLASFKGALGHIIGNRADNYLSKMNMIQGLDASGQSDHSWFPWTSSQHVVGTTTATSQGPRFHYSIDAVLAASSKIYPTTPKIGVLRIDPREALHTYSYLGTDPATGRAKQAGAEGKSVASTWQAISSQLNPGGGTNITSEKKKYLVDQFLAETQAIKNSRQISSEDKSLLSNFSDQLMDIQKRIAAPATNLTCATPNITEPTDNFTLNRRLMDIMALAMSCGVTKIGTYHLNWVAGMGDTDMGSRGQPNVHDVIHHFGDASGYPSLLKWWGTALDHYMYMVSRMDAMGLLDKSVVVFTSDFSTSNRGHHGIDLPVLTAGGLNGKLKTGDLISYQNMSVPKFEDAYATTPTGAAAYPLRPGRRYNDFLVTILQAAGLTPAEYQRMGQTGFGSYDCEAPNNGCAGAEGMLNGKLMAYQTSSSYPETDHNKPLPYLFRG